MLDGTYAIYERTTEKGNETEQAVNQVTITGESEDKRKATFSFYVSASKNPDEIMSALKGKTFNSVKFDKVYIISFQQISIGAGE
nr:MAG TPA: MAP/microtubule affinity-regulating kinase 3 domain, ELKL motif, MARK3 [Caudoviricetes sp.]